MSAPVSRAERLGAPVLVLLATLAFGVGVAIERAEAGEHQEAGGHAEETILGIEVESTPLVVLGVVLSLAVVLAIWRLPERRWVLAGAALFCLAFAVLDGVEVSRKLGEETTIAMLALAALVLHAAAGGLLLVAIKRSGDRREAGHWRSGEDPAAKSA